MRDRAHVAQGGGVPGFSAAPRLQQLGVAAAALTATPARDAAGREVCDAVAAWLERVATPSHRQRGTDRCECGAALAHVVGAGLRAVLCPRCDADRLEDSDEDEDASNAATTATIQARASGFASWAVLLALVVLLVGCASSHGRVEDGPLYVHLCEAMPEDDQRAWGFAAGDINAELGEPVLWVGHGPVLGCNNVDVCPSSAVREGAETRIGECVITVRYAPGSAREVAASELGAMIRELSGTP